MTIGTLLISVKPHQRQRWLVQRAHTPGLEVLRMCRPPGIQIYKPRMVEYWTKLVNIQEHDKREPGTSRAPASIRLQFARPNTACMRLNSRSINDEHNTSKIPKIAITIHGLMS